MPENLLLLNHCDFLNENFRGYFSHQNATFDTNFKFEWTLPLSGGLCTKIGRTQSLFNLEARELAMERNKLTLWKTFSGARQKTYKT